MADFKCWIDCIPEILRKCVWSDHCISTLCAYKLHDWEHNIDVFNVFLN